MTTSNRRTFLLGLSTAVAASTAAVPLLTGHKVFGQTNPVSDTSTQGGCKFQLGLASYTARSFDQAGAIAMSKRTGLTSICFKDFHLPLSATDDECRAAAEACRKEGLHLYGAGVISMGKPADVANAFRYAQAAGMNTIVCSPQIAVLPEIDRLVKATGIYIAIHNHGPGDKVYPLPENVVEHVKDMDGRIGCCMDIGHTVRYGGDPVADIKKYKDRLFDIHFKDVTKAEASGTTAICGRGVIDLPAVVAALKEVGYSRIASFEYEAEAKDPLPGLAESVGYIRALMKVV